MKFLSQLMGKFGAIAPCHHRRLAALSMQISSVDVKKSWCSYLQASMTFKFKCQPPRIDLKEMVCLSEGNCVYSETKNFACVFEPHSMQNVLPSTALSPDEDTEEEVSVQEKEKMINISYELAAEASKRSKLVAGTSLERQREEEGRFDQTNA